MSTAPAPRLGFRADINGLRAIAVLAVIAYHFQIPPFKSGFTGVDVFFVISGYLMTGIILGRLDRDTFTLAGFWLDRARRIIPALALLVATVLALGWFILLPDEYIILSRHAAAAATFLSNISFYSEAGYFDPGADQKWLLHTWSLSVEWQFYLLYPLLLLALDQFAPRRLLRPILAGLAALSFALMVWLHDAEPNAAFFMLPPRAWEMLAGGIVFLTPSLTGRASRAAQLWGFALIALSAIAFRPEDWPHEWALLPVLGTALVILAGRTNSRIMTNRPVALIGLASYSIYLWHWPVVAGIARAGHAGQAPWIAGGIAVSLLLGWLSWRYIERIAQPRTDKPRIHTGPTRFDWRPHVVFVVPILVLAGVSGLIWKARGIPTRFSDVVQTAFKDSQPASLPEARSCYSHIAGVPEPCVLGNARGPLLATVLGDSHAEVAIRAVLAARPSPESGAVAFNAYASCPPVLGVKTKSQCGAFIARYLEPMAAKPRTEPLILSARWAWHFRSEVYRFPDGKGLGPNLIASMCRLAKAGPTYVVMPTPEFPAFWVSRELQHRLVADPDAPDIVQPRAEFDSMSRVAATALRQAAAQCGVHLLDPVPYICDGKICRGSTHRRAIFRDENHLSAYGVNLLVPMFRPVFTDRSATPNPVQ
ncbi:acyltransferase family protein [Sphingomonas sp. AOB5]|uniref:acyltransferase family protein n=1 Tax=Sphingomonas sp. AOB5 TaxID=3034017 RepID=UPI0023F9F252|nr:acyltransferase family protein [Sphingomonas sp. AOB5]MDF7777424.1 acyltransferase family protein [Sphingomonas sp. AOB5]